jgi:FKBP-type peptidyl-prolyl cis-trans isomerase SlyD
MAGQNLHFKGQILTVREATQDELAHGHAHGADGHSGH